MSSQRKHNTGYILRICGIAALGGILFGYDTAVISGAIESLKTYFNLSPAETGWAVSNVVIGCVVGAFAAGPLAGRYGRKKALMLAAVLFTISAVGSSLAPTFTWFVIYRISAVWRWVSPRPFRRCTCRKSHPKTCAAVRSACSNSPSCSAKS